jgi:hypothetical protein
VSSSQSLFSKIKKGKAISVTDRRGPQGCDTSRLPHFLDTDGAESYEPAALYPQEDSWYSFLLEAILKNNTCFFLLLRMMKTYEKLHKFTGVISYFCTRQWKFSNQNVQKMWSNMSEEDRKIFDFNIRNLNWDKYLGEGLMGVRTFVLKDDPKRLPEAIKKRYR